MWSTRNTSCRRLRVVNSEDGETIKQERAKKWGYIKYKNEEQNETKKYNAYK